MLVFYEIPTHKNYLISKNGVVKNKKTNRVLKACSTSSNGYFTVYVDGKNILLHRLLAETFIPNLENKPCINHIDGNKLNNSLENLEWCTYKENLEHARKTGLNPYKALTKEKSRHHKLTENEVQYIKDNYEKYSKNYSGRALSKKFNVSESCISEIILGKSWVGG